MAISSFSGDQPRVRAVMSGAAASMTTTVPASITSVPSVIRREV